MIRKAVIPAAGWGTRLLPATKALPKEMLPVVDKPVIQYVVEEAVAAGITDILMVIGKGKRAIEEHFDRSFDLEAELTAKGKEPELQVVRRITELADVHFVWQKELKGLGDAVLCAKHHVGNEPFAVLLGDTLAQSSSPVTRQLVEVFERYQGPVVALEEMEWNKVSHFGVIGGREITDGVYRIDDLIEKPSPDEAPSNLTIASRYVLTPDIFACIERTARGRNNEIQLTDALRLLLAERPMYGLRFDGRRYDVGSSLDLLKANLDFALMREDLRPEVTRHIRGLAEQM